MNPLRTLHLQLEEARAVPVLIRRESTERSPHTGRELVELHGWSTTADPEMHRSLSAALRGLGERPVRAFDEQGETAGRWWVSWNSYGEKAGVHTYTLLLREVEELTIEALLVDTLELHPYEYREEVVGEGLTVCAKVVGTRADLAELEEVLHGRPAYTVVRRGIQEEPREMRLGVGEWSEEEDVIKYRLVLVDSTLDTAEQPELARIEEENTRAAIGFYANFLERLTDRLVERGVLSREELDELRSAARLSPGPPRRELWRVVDVDDL